MQDIIKILSKITDLIDYFVREYKKAERKRNIEKIKNNPNKAWEDRFGGKNE